MPLDEDIPEHWDPMPPSAPSLAVPITARTSEHTEVLTLFQASCNRTVIKVQSTLTVLGVLYIMFII